MKVFRSINEVKKYFLPKLWESERDKFEKIREKTEKIVRKNIRPFPPKE